MNHFPGQNGFRPKIVHRGSVSIFDPTGPEHFSVRNLGSGIVFAIIGVAMAPFGLIFGVEVGAGSKFL